MCLIVGLFILSPFSVEAQSTGIKIQINDQEGAPVSEVSVVLLPKQEIYFSNVLGQVDLVEEDFDSLVFQKVGYATLKLSRQDLNPNHTITLSSFGGVLETVQVVGRSDWSSSRFAQEIQVLDEKEIQQLQGRSTADILEASGEVFVQRSQLGGGSPIIRGFEANRILLVVDGVRLNNAIYRSGHLHNSLSVDQFGLGSIEIHAGPNALLYGSDALGGVLHFKTKNARFREEAFGLDKVDISTLYQSAAHSLGSHLDFSLSGKKFSSFSSVSYNRIGDLRVGDRRSETYEGFGLREVYVERKNGEDLIVENENPNIQVGSGYTQLDIIQKFNFKLSEKDVLSFNLQYNDAPAPRFDQLSVLQNGIPEFAEWDYDPQNRFLASVTLDHYKSTRIFDRARVLASYQRINEGRATRFFQSDLRISNTEALDVGGLTIDLVKGLGGKIPIRLYYGAEAQYNTLVSKVSAMDITNGQEQGGVFTRYPSGENELWNGGLYGLLQSDLNSNYLSIDLGARLSWYHVNMSYSPEDSFDWPQNFLAGVVNEGIQPTFSGAITCTPLETWTFKVMSSTAFRAPNIDDIAKVRIRNGQVLTPNLDLQPENAWNNELSIGWKSKNIFIQGLAFYTQVDDIIARRNGALPNGDTLIISDGRPFRVQINDNQEKGRIWGTSWDLKWSIHQSLTLNTNFTKIWGALDLQSGQDAPLGHIPPAYGRFGLDYSESSWEVGVFTLFNGGKPLDEYDLGGSDNEDFATQDGSPSWFTLNVKSQWNHGPWTIGVRVENILDTHYRTFASGISAAGINGSIQVTYSWAQ